MSGSSGNAQKEAQQAEEQRQAAIKQATQGIEAIYSSPERQQQYTDFYEATRTLGQQDLDKQKREADLNAKFALARGGMTGGSRARDVGTELGKDYLDGLLMVDRRALGAKSDLQNADQQSKNNLFALAQSGLDMTTAQANAAASLRSNLDAANSTRLAGGLGDLFGGIADINKKSEEERIRRQSAEEYGQGMRYSPYYSYGYGG